MSDLAFHRRTLRSFQSFLSRPSIVALAIALSGACLAAPSALASKDDPGDIFGGPGQGEPYLHRLDPRVLLAPMPERKPRRLRSYEYSVGPSHDYKDPPRPKKKRPRHAPAPYAPEPYEPEGPVYDEPEYADADPTDGGKGFGRLFPHESAGYAPPYRALQALGRTMVDKDAPDDPAGDSELPAGYTFLGQFIDHDLTLDTTSDLGFEIRGDYELKNARTPELDLDSVYGGGPEQTPHLYRLPYIRVGTPISAPHELPRYDLFRTKMSYHYGPTGGKAVALLGDPRNDENIIVSQLHAAFVAFHNRTVDILIEQDFGDERHRYCTHGHDCGPQELAAQLPKPVREKIFETARDHVIHYYHRLIIDDFLPRTIGPRHTASLLKRGRDFYFPDGFRDSHGRIKDIFIPIEFAAAAFRYGHSQVRDSYVLRRKVRLSLLSDGRNNAPRAFEPVTPELLVDWAYFFEIGHKTPYGFNYSRRIDPELAKGLHELHFANVVGMDEVTSLAARNLARGRSLHLPSGQEIAKIILPALEARGLLGKGDWDPGSGYDGKLWRTFLLPPDKRTRHFLREGETPLWYYILQEAAYFGTRTNLEAIPLKSRAPGRYSSDYGRGRHYGGLLRPAVATHRRPIRHDYAGPDGGHRLGPVGAAIVGEVLTGLVEHYRVETGKGLDYKPLIRGSESRLVGLDSRKPSGHRYLMRNFLIDAGVVEGD